MTEHAFWEVAGSNDADSKATPTARSHDQATGSAQSAGAGTGDVITPPHGTIDW